MPGQGPSGCVCRAQKCPSRRVKSKNTCIYIFTQRSRSHGVDTTCIQIGAPPGWALDRRIDLIFTEARRPERPCALRCSVGSKLPKLRRRGPRCAALSKARMQFSADSGQNIMHPLRPGGRQLCVGVPQLPVTGLPRHGPEPSRARPCRPRREAALDGLPSLVPRWWLREGGIAASMCNQSRAVTTRVGPALVLFLLFMPASHPSAADITSSSAYRRERGEQQPRLARASRPGRRHRFTVHWLRDMDCTPIRLDILLPAPGRSAELYTSVVQRVHLGGPWPGPSIRRPAQRGPAPSPAALDQRALPGVAVRGHAMAPHRPSSSSIIRSGHVGKKKKAGVDKKHIKVRSGRTNTQHRTRSRRADPARNHPCTFPKHASPARLVASPRLSIL